MRVVWTSRGGDAKGVKEGAGGGAHNKCKKSRATPAAQNKVTSTTTEGRTSPKIDSIMCVRVCSPPPFAGYAPAQNDTEAAHARRQQ